jgi:hypothetical protein
MQKRLITLLTLLLLLLVFTLPQAAQAKPHLPLVNSYINHLDWNDGTNYGGRTVFKLNWPSLISGEFYHQEIYLDDSSASESGYAAQASVHLGIEEVPAGDADPFGCTDGTQTKDMMFSYAYAWDNTNNLMGNFCYPSKNNGWLLGNSIINTNMRFTVWGAASGGLYYAGEIYDSNVSPAVSHVFTMTSPNGTADPEFSDEQYYESCSCGLTTGEHEIWGSTWTQNTWIDGSGVFHNHSTPSSPCSKTTAGCPFYGPPGSFAMYWQNGFYPGDSGSNGGTLISCLYESYPSNYPYCTIGS